MIFSFLGSEQQHELTHTHQGCLHMCDIFLFGAMRHGDRLKTRCFSATLVIITAKPDLSGEIYYRNNKSPLWPMDLVSWTLMFGWVWFMPLLPPVSQVRQRVGTLGRDLRLCGAAHPPVRQVSGAATPEGKKKTVRDNQDVGARVCVTPPKPGVLRANWEHTSLIKKKKGLFRELGPLNYTSNNSSEEKSLFRAAGIIHGHQLLQSPLGNGAAGVLVWDIFRFNSRLLNMRRKTPEQMVEV